MTDKKEKAMDQ